MTLTDSQAGTLLVLMCYTDPITKQIQFPNTKKPMLKKDILNLLIEKNLVGRRIGVHIMNELEKYTLKNNELLMKKKKIRANLMSRGFNYSFHEDFPLFGLYQNQSLLKKMKKTKLIYLGTLYALLPYMNMLPLQIETEKLTTVLNKPSSRTLINHLSYLQSNELLSFTLNKTNITIDNTCFSVKFLGKNKTFPIPSSIKNEKEYIYFLKEPISHTVKIGKTRNYQRRLNNHGVLLPFKTETLFVFEVKNRHQAETDFIHYFKQKRHEKTEWFKLDQNDLFMIENLSLPKNMKEQIVKRII